MDLFTIIGTCLRRWYVVLPVLAISGYFAMQAYQQVEPEYTAAISIVILPNQSVPGEASADVPTLDNPYAGSGGPKLAAAVLSKNINSSSFHDRLGLPASDLSTFQSSVAQAQPIITVDAIGSSREAVISTLDAVTTSARVVLDEFQALAEAPEAKRYLVAAAVPASDPTDVTPSRWRTAGAILVVGSLLAALLAVSIDAALKARRREERSDDAKREPAEPGPYAPEAEVDAPEAEVDAEEHGILVSDLRPIEAPDPQLEVVHDRLAEPEAPLHTRTTRNRKPRAGSSVSRARTSEHRDT